MDEAAEAKAEMAAAPEAERPSDPGSITTTLSAAHATQVLKDALDKIFAPSLDDRLKASMPDFWKLYYQAAAAKIDYRPTDPCRFAPEQQSTKRPACSPTSSRNPINSLRTTASLGWRSITP